MSLPRELLDEILSHLHPDDKHNERRTLRNCSLVAESWVHPARRRLFKTVEIREKNLQSWLDSIPPANEGLLQHVRSLSYVTDATLLQATPAARSTYCALQDYLLSLPQLQHLSLSSMDIPSDISRQIEIFSAFRYTLLRLSLCCCTVTISALVTLLNYFPSLNHLDLTNLIWNEVDATPAPPLSHSLIEELWVSAFDENHFGLLNQLSKLGLVFGEVVLNRYPMVRPRNLERVVNAVGVNVKRLRLMSRFGSVYSGRYASSILSRCRELRELEVATTYPGIDEVHLISSITSTSIRKVTFVHGTPLRGLPRRDADWGILDDPLCQLVDKLGCNHELEVNLRFRDIGVMEVDEETRELRILNSLAKFREKGRIRVVLVDVDHGSETVVHSSGV